MRARGALDALGHLVDARRRAVLVAWAVVLAGAVALLPRFRIDPDVAALLPSDHPDVGALVGVGAIDPSSRDLLVVVRDSALVADRARFDALVEEISAAPEVVDLLRRVR